MIEEILPLNYYNEMIGIVADNTIIKLLVNKFIPNLSPFLEEKKDFLGDFIGNNFISRGLTNLFSNGMIDREISLLIWDYLFIEGNKVLLKTFLAFYYYLSDVIIKGEKSLEFYNKITTKEVKKIKINNEDFIYNLFFKDDNFISKMNLNEIRFNLSLQVADNLEEENIEHVKTKVRVNYEKFYDKQMDKALTCNKKWPYCINDTYFENVNKTVLYSVFHESNNKYISNYFFPSDKEKEEFHDKDIDDDDRMYQIKVERRPHYCTQIQKEIKIKPLDNNIIENENDKYLKDNEDEKQKYEANKINRLYHRTATSKSFLDTTKVFEQKMDMQINNIKKDE